MYYLKKTTKDNFSVSPQVIEYRDSNNKAVAEYCPYVPGLVFWLDGIHTGTSSGNWTDLIGGHVFTNTGATYNNNGWYFNNTYKTEATCYMQNSDNLNLLKTNCTIEVVYDCEINNYFCLFIQKQSGGIIWGTNGDGTQYISSVGALTPIFPRTSGTETITASLRTGLMYKNGESVSTSSTTNQYSTIPSYNCIGYSSGVPNWAFKGTIYSIRIYNRLLSADEMIYNQSVDNIRFNLGMTLTNSPYYTRVMKSQPNNGLSGKEDLGIGDQIPIIDEPGKEIIKP